MESRTHRKAETQFYRSVLVKVWAGASAIGIAISLAIGLVSYLTVRGNLMDGVKQTTVAFAKVAAAKIDGDAFGRITPESGRNAEYAAVHRCLSDFFANEGIHYIYTLRLVGDRMQFVVDSDPKVPGKIGEDYEVQPGVIEAYRRGEAYAIDEPYTDRWGMEYSGYAPIRDSKGRVVGMVAVDCSVNAVQARLNTLVWRVALAAAVCFLAAMTTGLLLACLITRELKSVIGKIVAPVDSGALDD